MMIEFLVIKNKNNKTFFLLFRVKSVNNQWKTDEKCKKSKKSTKKDKFQVPPQEVDQLLHVNQF